MSKGARRRCATMDAMGLAGPGRSTFRAIDDAAPEVDGLVRSDGALLLGTTPVVA